MTIKTHPYKNLYAEYMSNKRSIAKAEIHISSLIHCAETVSVEKCSGKIGISNKEIINQILQMIKYHQSLLAEIVASNEDIAEELNRRGWGVPSMRR